MTICSSCKQLSTAHLIKERGRLLQSITSLAGMIKGSRFQRYSTCSRSACACHRDERKRHGPRAYVVTGVAGCQRQYYIPRGQENGVREGVEQFRRLSNIIERITAINVELMRRKELTSAKENAA